MKYASADSGPMRIEPYPFDDDGCRELSEHPMGLNWPVVYILHSDGEVYVGETGSAANRMRNHLDNPGRRGLTWVKVVFDGTYNKSVVLDFEQTLIRLFSADRKFAVQNRNAGQSYRHEYFGREEYRKALPSLWNELRSKYHMADLDYEALVGSDLFRYSPYTALTEEQRDVSRRVVLHMLDSLTSGVPGASVVNGTAGTGKTLLAMSLLLTLAEASRPGSAGDEVERAEYVGEDCDVRSLRDYVEAHGPLKIGLVFPMESLRNTIAKVLDGACGCLADVSILPPHRVAGEEFSDGFDVLIVDEGHRLKKRKNLSYYAEFDGACEKLGLDKGTANQMDWIVARSRYQVVFYDEHQHVSGMDVTDREFRRSLEGVDVEDHRLTSQMRCLAGDGYERYVRDVLDCSREKREAFDEALFEFRVFDDVEEMVQTVRSLDSDACVARTVAGFAWPWKKDGEPSHFEIDGHDYVWNTTRSGWVLSRNARNEIGCVYSTQGYDLGYVGVIFGPEIDYDPADNRLVVDPDRVKDTKIKSGFTKEERRNGVMLETVRSRTLNAYYVLMTRGVRGCFVYACNEGLRGYLKRFIGPPAQPN